MPAMHRVLDERPVEALDSYLANGGGKALAAARQVDGTGIAAELKAAGLRGRGGAGFPTGVKWETVAAAAVTGPPPVVVVNGAEGEPGSFKDRTLLRQNPYRILEGALVAACAVHARHVVVALKQSFRTERRRLAYAIAEICDAGWPSGVDVHVATGPGDYLFGEETALLEVVEGRQPFPRIAPPFRRGLGESEDEWSESALVLANNVETLANVPDIVMRGADWFRSVGTPESPGTIVCTVSGDTRRAGVAEFPMGTSVGGIVDELGGGARPDRRIVAAMSGVANPILPVDLFDTPASYEALRAVGSGLGAAGFIVFDDGTHLVSVAAGVSRFLAVESCGQCEPCKRDGLAVAADLDAVRRSEADPDVVGQLRDRLSTITDGARCNLAAQHQLVVSSVLDLYGAAVERHLGAAEPAEAVLIAPIVEIEDGTAVLDASQAGKQPDWSYDDIDSGRWPAAYLGNTPVEVRMFGHPARVATGRSAATTGGAVPAVPATMAPEVAEGARIADADERPIPVGVGDQLDLVHQELVDSLLTIAMSDDDARARREAVEEFGDRLRSHIEVTTHVLLPWVRRVGGDEGERVADRAEGLADAAEHLLDRLGTDPSPPRFHALADELHRMILDEERQVLPILERHLDDDDLDDIGRAMYEARHQRPQTRRPRRVS